MHTKIFSALLLVSLLALFSVRAAAAEQPGRIVAERVTGSVTVINLSDQSTVPLQNGDTLRQGQAVRTAKGASVVLVFSNGATINVGADTQLSVDQFLQDPFNDEVKVSDLKEEPTVSTTKLKLSYGEIVGNVRHLHQDRGSTFAVDTPVGAAGIRGTTFRIVYRPEGNGKAFFSLGTLEGRVLFSTQLNGSYEIPSGRQIVIHVTVDPKTGAIHLEVDEGDLTPDETAFINEILEQIQVVDNGVIFNTQFGRVFVPFTSPPPSTTPGAGSTDAPTNSTGTGNSTVE